MNSTQTPCPCLSGHSYSACCQALHNSNLNASSPEQLMRSRYCAFYLAKVDYLIATLHPQKRRTNDATTLAQSIEKTKWLGLKIIDRSTAGKTATVEFVAFYQEQGIAQLHERSEFRKENDQWFYYQGEYLAPKKLSRNEICFCGSGKKFKKCHIDLA